jgi:hypothetical protein
VSEDAANVEIADDAEPAARQWWGEDRALERRAAAMRHAGELAEQIALISTVDDLVAVARFLLDG